MTLPKLVKLSDLNSDSDHVMILDSGAGAHSIYEECKKLRPKMNYLIIEDKSFFPYGDKDPKQLEERFAVVAKEVSRHKPLAFIIACNTASTHALEIFRERLNCPVIGTVPPIKMAASSSASKCIALLATPATISSSYTSQLIKDFARDTEVHLIPTPNLAKICESYHTTKSICRNELQTELKALETIDTLDTIALGCTHYHLIKDEIALLYPNCQLIDCSSAIAKQFDRISPQITQQKPTVEHCYI